MYKGQNISPVWVLTLLIISSCISDLAGANDYLVIIAYPKQVRESAKSCNDLLPAGTVCMDGVIELRYEVDEVLYGAFEEGQIISMYDFYHYGGFPDYVTRTSVYMTIIKRDSEYFLIETAYLIDNEDQLWVCGSDLNPFVADGEDGEPPYEPIANADCFKGVELERLRKYFAQQK